MPHASWMIERLNDATRPHHLDADADFDLLFRDDASSSHYMLFLMRVYGFDAPLESALAMTPNLPLVIDLKERFKAGCVAQDVMALGLRPNEVAELAQCMSIPSFSGSAEALGWMYVVERATLAHSVIRRHLQTKLPRDMSRASAYLQSYTSVVGTRWRTFGSVLDDVARMPAVAERIIQAAEAAFRCQRSWIQHDQDMVRAEAV